MKAVVFDHFGDPADVLQVRDVAVPVPACGQVRVRMRASPVNPSDLLVVRGEYGRLPRLPATPGFEGVGVLDAAGPGLLRHLRRLVPGRRVATLNAGGGNWQEYVVLPARQAVPLPAALPDDQAATFFVNPASALVMVRYVLRVPRGAWLLQTAAGSALGRMVIRLGLRDGFRTINVVRRREQAQELLRLGGNAAVCTIDESIEERVRALTGGAGVPFALDAVGGATGSAVVRALAPGGRLLAYGVLSGEPLALDPRTLIAGQKHVEGFWLADWALAQGIGTMLGLFRRLARLTADGVLTSEVGASFPLDQVREAVRQAETPGRRGKVLLTMAPPG
jgi:NADPH:quinone reductase-like Zn-dependent oxidoreductase